VKRGDLVIVSPAGDYGKPRPAIVIQSDSITATESVLVALLTSALVDVPIYRLTIEPTQANGLEALSQVMVDKIVAISRAKCGKPIGRIEQGERHALDRLLAVMIGLADSP
jgi:mRNA interferase MazF